MKARRRNCVVATLEGTWCWPIEHIWWSSSLWPTRLSIYHTITQFSDHNKDSPFLVSGRNILINMRLVGRKILLISEQTIERLFPFLHPERNIFLKILEVGRWLVLCAGRAGSHRTSGLSMPQTPTTERCATWDCCDHRTEDTPVRTEEWCDDCSPLYSSLHHSCLPVASKI